MASKRFAEKDDVDMKRWDLRYLLLVVSSMFFFWPSIKFGVFAQDTSLTQVASIINRIAWKPDGTTLAIAGTIENEAGVWLSNVDTGELSKLSTPNRLFNVLSVAWDWDGDKVAALASGEVYTYYIWDTATGNLITSFEQEGETSDFSIYWGPDGTKLATVAGYAVFVRDAVTGEILETLRESASSADTVEAVAWHSTGQYIFIASGDNIIRVWDVTTGTKTNEFPLSHQISSMSLSPDGTALAIGSDNGVVHVFDDTLSTAPLYTLESSLSQVIFIKWHPNSSEIATADIRGNVVVWDLDTQRIIDTIANDAEVVLQDVSYSPYGGRLAYSSRVLAMEDGQPVQLSGETVTQTLANGAVQIIVPAPSLERLQAIADACNAPDAVAQELLAFEAVSQLSTFVSRVKGLPENVIPPACAADLIAVAEALR